MTQLQVRPAAACDAPGVAACVCEAYVGYIERIGRQPAPMLDDYAIVIQTLLVHVAVQGGRVVGVIVLKAAAECFFVENVAVRPVVRGIGVGRRLLELGEAEARRQGYTSICLATHQLMVGNKSLYRRVGYVEGGRRLVEGYPRVFFRKSIARHREPPRRCALTVTGGGHRAPGGRLGRSAGNALPRTGSVPGSL